MAKYVKGDAVPCATSYELFENVDGTYNSLATGDEINFEVSATALAFGDHVLAVKAHADGFTSSEYSNEVTYTRSVDDVTSNYGFSDEANVYTEDTVLASWTPGTQSGGELTTTSSRLRTDEYVAFRLGDIVEFNLADGWSGYATQQGYEGSAFVSFTYTSENEGWIQTGEKIAQFNGRGIVILKNDNDTTPTADEYAADGCVVTYRPRTVDINRTKYTLTADDFMNCGVSNRQIEDNAARLCTNWIDAFAGSSVEFELADGWECFMRQDQGGETTVNLMGGGWYSGTFTHVFDTDGCFIIVLRKSTDSTIAVDDYNSTITVNNVYMIEF